MGTYIFQMNHLKILDKIASIYKTVLNTVALILMKLFIKKIKDVSV